MYIELDEVMLNEEIHHFSDYDKPIGLNGELEPECWAKYRQSLIKSKDVIKYSKVGKVKVMTIELKPRHFLWVDRNTYRHLELNHATEQVTITNYTRRQWFAEHIPEEVTKSTFHPAYHPGYQYLCNVLFNARGNAIGMYQTNVRTRYINKIVSHNTSATEMTFYFRVASCRVSGGCFINTNDTEFTISTNEVGYPTFKRDGQITDDMFDLIDLMELLEGQFYYKKGYSMHRDYVPIYRILEPVINDWVVGKSMSRDYHVTIADRLKEQMYNFENGPSYDDLPFSQIELVGLYNQYKYWWNGAPAWGVEMRQKVSRAIAHKDSRAAVDECFYGYVFPNSIRKLLIKAGLLRFNVGVYRLIDKAIKRHGVDRTRDFITDPAKGGALDVAMLQHRRILLATFALGWEVIEHRRLQRLQSKDRETKRRLRDKDVLLDDAIDMYDYLIDKNADFELQSRNVKEIHDQLAPIYTAYKATEWGSEMDALKTVSTADQLKPLHVGEFTFRSPFVAYELITVGREMRHCVSAYATSFYYKNLDIALLVRDDEYLVCLEIRGEHVVQAKMRFNIPVRENPEYVELVKQFMALNGLIMATSDINGSMKDSWVRYQELSIPKDSDRVAKVQAIKKAKREAYLAKA